MTVTYVANGDKRLGKEFLEVFGSGLLARLDDYRTLTIRKGSKRINRVARLHQDKGHKAEWEAIVAYLTGKGTIPIPFEGLWRRVFPTSCGLGPHPLNPPLPIIGEGEKSLQKSSIFVKKKFPSPRVYRVVRLLC